MKLVFSWMLVVCFAAAALGGNLEPMGPPGSTMKPLDQVEPRTPITSLPFTITQSGSYYVVSNLGGAGGSNGITIDANNVSIDLCGFALVGKAGYYNDGICVNPYKNNISVINGTVSDWGGTGVDCVIATTNTNCIISNIRAFKNGYGINGGPYALITKCSAVSNAVTGITAGAGSTISNCTSTNNANAGFYAGSGSCLTNCMAVNNAMYGFNIIGTAAIIGCTATYNGIGINSYSGRIDGCVVSLNRDQGIFAISDSLIINNVCTGNGTNPSNSAGIHVSDQGNRIENNNVNGNDYGIQVYSAGNVIIKNSARGNTVNNYNIVAGNDVGPIGSAATATSPWANISY